MHGSCESSFFFCKVFCVTSVDLQEGRQVLKCSNTGEDDSCQPWSLWVEEAYFKRCCCSPRWGTMACLSRWVCPLPVQMFWLFPLTLSQLVSRKASFFPFFLFHIKEFGSYQILAVIERNHCCRATNTDVAVLLNSISWFSNADRLWVFLYSTEWFLYPTEWVFLGSTRFFFFNYLATEKWIKQEAGEK